MEERLDKTILLQMQLQENQTLSSQILMIQGLKMSFIKNNLALLNLSRTIQEYSVIIKINMMMMILIKIVDKNIEWDKKTILMSRKISETLSL